MHEVQCNFHLEIGNSMCIWPCEMHSCRLYMPNSHCVLYCITSLSEPLIVLCHILSSQAKRHGLWGGADLQCSKGMTNTRNVFEHPFRPI